MDPKLQLQLKIKRLENRIALYGDDDGRTKIELDFTKFQLKQLEDTPAFYEWMKDVVEKLEGNNPMMQRGDEPFDCFECGETAAEYAEFVQESRK